MAGRPFGREQCRAQDVIVYGMDPRRSVRHTKWCFRTYFYHCSITASGTWLHGRLLKTLNLLDQINLFSLLCRTLAIMV